MIRLFKRGKNKSLPQSEHQATTESEEKKKTNGKLDFDEAAALRLARPDTRQENELRRMEAYIERPTQKLLQSLMDNPDESEILPVFDPTLGFRYKTAELALGDGVAPEKVPEFLERLTSIEILKKVFFDSVSSCPNCGLSVATLHYSCPRCASRHIIKTGLTEHIPCGNIDERDNYFRGDSSKCPKCGKVLAEGQYRDMGLWYVCRNCGERLEHPNLNLVCRRCQHEYNINTAVVREISKYHLNTDKEKEIRQNVTSLENINRILLDLGFMIMPPTTVGGKSGIEHTFSIMAKKSFGDKEYIVAVDHAVGDIEANVSPLILYIYKITEVKVDLPIFIAIPKLSETAKKIAKGYNIFVIEGVPQEKEQVALLQDEIRRRLTRKIAEDRKRAFLPPAEVEVIHQWIIRHGTSTDVFRDRKGKFVKQPGAETDEVRHGISTDIFRNRKGKFVKRPREEETEEAETKTESK